MAKRKSTDQEKIDKQVDEWMDKTDFSKAIAKGKVIPGRGRPAIGTKISLTLPEELIRELKEAAEKRSIGYQTMIRMIVKENIKNYA